MMVFSQLWKRYPCSAFGIASESDCILIMAIPIPSRQLFIDGEWREPVNKNRLPIINPATEENIGASLELFLWVAMLCFYFFVLWLFASCFSYIRRLAVEFFFFFVGFRSFGCYVECRYYFRMFIGECWTFFILKVGENQFCKLNLKLNQIFGRRVLDLKFMNKYGARFMRLMIFFLVSGVIPAATAEDVNIAVEAARKAFFRNGGKDWASATGAHRAKYLRAIAAKVCGLSPDLGFC